MLGLKKLILTQIASGLCLHKVLDPVLCHPPQYVRRDELTRQVVAKGPCIRSLTILVTVIAD
jgi:hypothetical protein